ncbi:DUF4190 domain-containing protein [Corynebacterium cystitidis]|uniref:DUF4190 domain-containing protein n=1 Tax=Corynebacterium cystitidis TaxID=35757 RepID=UPI00211E9208|nr:DUF4190 domain-containing protein [Corynebacterium cystitidis]
MTDRSNPHNPFDGEYSADNDRVGSDQDAYPSFGQTSDATGDYPGGAYPGEYEEKNNLALWAMILGIIAVVLTLTIIGAVFGIGLILGIIAVVLGILGLRRAGKMVGPNRRKGMAITGIVLGSLSILATFAIFAMSFFGLKWFADRGVFEACEPYIHDDVAYQQCIEEETANLLR